MHEIFRDIHKKINLVSSSLSDIKSLFEAYHCCVLVPTYNNGGTVKKVIEEVMQYTSNVIVVNDGSTDNTTEELATISGIQVLTYSPNQGKGMALRKGFEYAYSKGYHYVITIDSDGQHFASDIPKFIHKMIEQPDALIIGARNMDQASVPGKSSYGNKFSNFWFWVETGIKIPDTQSGFRLYPLKPLQEMEFYTPKYELEIEIIVRAAWRGVPVVTVPVSVFYAPAATRISHFRPFRDFMRITALNTVLVILALLFHIPIRFFRNIKKKNLKQLIVDNIIGGEESNLKKSLSIALGIFIGIVPLWGYQIITVIALSHLLKLNKVLAVLASNISIPPMFPFIIFFSYEIGGSMLGNSNGTQNMEINWEFIKNNFEQYVVGSMALAVAASILTGALAFVLLSLFRKAKLKVNSIHE